MVFIKRDIEEEVLKWMCRPEILALHGPRQCGKTTLLLHIKEKLMHKDIAEQQLHYMSFEDDILRLKFQEDPVEFIERHCTTKNKHYFFLDEVQYIKDVGKRLKLIFDRCKNVKIIITGSSSFDLTNLGKYLVGRVILFTMYPFSFGEFLRTKDEKYGRLYHDVHLDLCQNFVPKKTVFLDDLNKLLHEYLTYGGYPAVVLEKDNALKKGLLKNIFITYVEKDIVVLYGRRFREKVVKLLKAIAIIQGNVVDYQTLSEHSGLKYHDVIDVLPLLNDSFVISIVKPFHKNLMNELRKNPKIYFCDYGLRNYLFEEFDSVIFDSLYENFVYNQLRRLHTIKYWRTTAKTEVDFVLHHKRQEIPIEVKTKPKITRSFRSFVTHYKPKQGFICNPSIIEKRKIEGCDIRMIPLSYL